MSPNAALDRSALERQQMRLIDYQGLLAKGVKWSKPHLWRKERDGEFPKRVPLGDRSVAWDESEIDNWIEERKAKRYLIRRGVVRKGAA
jgi:prophage regulatory protein